MTDLRDFLGSTSTLFAKLQYEFDGIVQPGSTAYFLVKNPSTLILYGSFDLPAMGGIQITGTLTLTIDPGGDTGRIVYTPTSGGGSMSQAVTYQANGSVLTLTPTDSSYHGTPSEELMAFFKEKLDAISYYTLEPVGGSGSETNTQLFADVAGLSIATVLVPAS